ncbi:uncharacterized protein MELLADRAFT_89353 [Melampsora larici-populina 98AG31]|uniref:Uncharacterized protein n=1 Tax=Melampsora larici-populina (strain 98AG31 / pathotype 3-4-7) TaxID=747676 RepID=F4R5U9_MELLP|nr:uncharacterized protein MELLADRAFT_89353 [Melampsora larici-populina 98AG31]EGG12101.1 hypothetical protein MELLADRAFT_89353 [Melampsora larici-populina 98AG31]
MVLPSEIDSMYRKHNQSALSVKSQNKAVANWLPDSNSRYAQAYIDFVKYLLGRIKPKSPYPEGPTASELEKLPDLSYEYIMNDQRVFNIPLQSASPTHEDPRISPRQKDCWIRYKQLFLLDLTIFGIERATLAMDQSENIPWNQTVLSFIVKHSQVARANGAFSQYLIDPKHDGDMLALGLFERWMRGRCQDIGIKTRNPAYQAKEKKKKDKAKVRMRYHPGFQIQQIHGPDHFYPQFQLLKYRRNTIKECLKLDPDAINSILSDSKCCSDTEEDETKQPRAVGIHWRSTEYTAVLHLIDKLSYKYQKDLRGARWAARRFDARRKPAIRVQGMKCVKKGLPENFYSPTFLSQLTLTERSCLTNIPPSEALETLKLKICASLP